MLYEMTRALELHSKLGLLIREAPDKILVGEISSMRKTIRQDTDRLLLALAQNDLFGVAHLMCEANYNLARIAIQTGARPDQAHFQSAYRQLVEQVRLVSDKGLQVKDWHQLQVGLAMLHSVMLAVAASLNIPYLAVFNHIHEAKMKADGVIANGELQNLGPLDIEGTIKAALTQP